MIITAIEKVSRKSRYEVYADGSLVGTMSADMILTYRLAKGVEISPETLTDILKEAERSDAWTLLLTWLGGKPYTTKMANDKLADNGFCEDAIAYAMQKAADYNYINDEEYATELVAELNPKRSTRRIKQDLYQRGLTGEYVDELLAQNDESEACYASLTRKLRGKSLEGVGELKTMQSLAGQGFGYDTIRAAIARYKVERDE